MMLNIFDGYNFVFSNHKYNCGITLSMSEFKNILQVKALIEALTKSNDSLWIASRFFDRKGMTDTALDIEKIRDENNVILNAFKCLPDDKETK